MNYPLIFGFRDLIAGNGFFASISINGRALLVEEDGEAWMEGVTPAGFAGTGNDGGRAYADFRERYRSILYDLATEASSFEQLKQAIEAFFSQPSEAALGEWRAAVELVRSGKIDADLPRKNADEFQPSLDVVQIQRPEAKDNRLDVHAVAA